MIKYRTFCEKIEAFEISRSTNKQVVLTNGRRENKLTEFSTWHDTWEEAHRYLIAMAAKDLDSLRLRLEQAKGKLGQIKGMKRPKP